MGGAPSQQTNGGNLQPPTEESASVETMRGDGDGWAQGPQGTKVWGRYGAAGLMLLAAAPGQDLEEIKVLLQHRAPWTNQGNTWGLPGGARDSHESAAEAAVRESVEEASIDPAAVEVLEEVRTSGPFAPGEDAAMVDGEPVGWSYTTVLARTSSGEEIDTTANEESLELRWVAFKDLENLPLLPAFAASLATLKEHLAKHL